MAQRYLLECKQCGRRTPIVESQAGQVIICNGCGSTQKLGTLREIRAMQSEGKPVPSASGTSGLAVSRRTVQWTPIGRALFAFGTLGLVAGTLLASYKFLQAGSLKTGRPVAEINPQKRKQIESAPPEVMVTLWDRVNARALETWEAHPYLLQREAARRLIVIAVAGIVVAVIGAVLLFGSFWFRQAGDV